MVEDLAIKIKRLLISAKTIKKEKGKAINRNKKENNASSKKRNQP